MKIYYSIGEAAKIGKVTIETLRHYDRIELLKPAKVDEHSGYRYYTEEELIYLEVIGFCRKNNMTLSEIKMIFKQDFTRIIEFLKDTEEKVDLEISRLNQVKKQVTSLYENFEDKVKQNKGEKYINDFNIKYLDKRAIVISDSLTDASIENFSKLHSDLYLKLGKDKEDKFIFDNSAYIFAPMNSEVEKLFSVCNKFEECEELIFLPKGNYLCCKCTQEQKKSAIEAVLTKAREEYNVKPKNIVLAVEFVGMFQWNYEVQVFIGELLK